MQPDGVTVERITVPSLEAPPPDGMEGATLYITLYSKDYHKEPVIVQPRDVGLISLKDEVADALWIAIPIASIWLSLGVAFIKSGSFTRGTLGPLHF